LWALADCASFYCSCERLFRPDLARSPVAVLSNNDGCVVAITQEAKDLGFKRGDVFFKSEKAYREANVAVFSSNYALYGDISRRVIAAMESLAPEVCQYSIDEAFLPFDRAMAERALELGRAIRERVDRWVGVPVRVGLGSTRTLAKLANHWAKKTSPVYLLEAGSDETERILSATPAGDVWGIGRRQAAKLEAMGIRTAKDLRSMDPALARKALSLTGQRTVLELRGTQCIEDDLVPAPRHTLVSSRSFGRKVASMEELSEALSMHASIAGEKLRREGLLAGSLSVHIDTGPYAPQPFHGGASLSLAQPSNSTSDFLKAARAALESCYRPGFQYVKAGVLLFDLGPEARAGRRSLFPPSEEQARDARLMAALDGINGKYGRDSIRFSSLGRIDPAWANRRERLSGLSTTSWDRLPLAKA
jgi:DNA polymerase V